MYNFIHHIFLVPFFINCTKDSHECSHVCWMEISLFISTVHHVSSVHCCSGASRMCTNHIPVAHVRGVACESNCHRNSRIGGCCGTDDIVMDLPIDKIDNPFGVSNCCSYLSKTRILGVESCDDSLWCYNACVSVRCRIVLSWAVDNVRHRFVPMSWIITLLQKFPLYRDLSGVTVNSD